MSARASLRLQQTVHQARRTPAAVPSAARQASSTSKQVQPRSFNSLLIGGSIGVAALAASAFAFKVGVTDNRKEAFEKLNGATAGRTVVAEPSTGKPVEAASEADAGEITASQSEASEQEDASQQAAFDPETGKINWDCPCLGGMAYGPCGEEFKDAFSCFVFSDQEPKGVDCVEKFKGMQDCFRRYPDVYERELAGVDEADDEIANESVTTVSTDGEQPSAGSEAETGGQHTPDEPEASFVNIKKEQVTSSSSSGSSESDASSEKSNKS